MPVKEVRVYDVSTNLSATVRVRKGGLETVGWLLLKVEGDLERQLNANDGGAQSVEITSLLAGRRKLDSKAWDKPLHRYFLYGFGWVVKSRVTAKKGVRVSVAIKSLPGKEETFEVYSDATVVELKRKIEKSKIGTPFDQQKLIFYGKQLEDACTLDTYQGIDSEGAKINLTSRLRGGRNNDAYGRPHGNGVSAIDPTKTEGLQRVEWSTSAPRWRIAAPGLCLEGVCTNRQCAAYRKDVIVNQGFGDFDLCTDRYLCECPMCSQKIDPITCAFNRCYWMWAGQRLPSRRRPPEREISGEWQRADDAYYRFDRKTTGSSRWLKLVFSTESLNNPVASSCAICLESLAIGVVNSADEMRCDHQFHDGCLREWKNHGRNNCPMCRAELEASDFMQSEAGSLSELLLYSYTATAEPSSSLCTLL